MSTNTHTAPPQSLELRDAIDSLRTIQVVGPGMGGYRNAFAELGYPNVVPFNTSSSAGDWDFIVSPDGVAWYWAWQENRYPRGFGFDRVVDLGPFFIGTRDGALSAADEYMTAAW